MLRLSSIEFQLMDGDRVCRWRVGGRHAMWRAEGCLLAIGRNQKKVCCQGCRSCLCASVPGNFYRTSTYCRRRIAHT